jgi:hypothetical protein
MIFNFRLSDELYAKYAERNPKSPQSSMERTLKRFAEVDPEEQFVVLQGDQLKQVKALLGHPVSTPEEVVHHLARYARVSFPEEGVEILLTAPQREKLKQQAAFWDQPFKKFLETQFTSAIARVIG